jgi:hypothetical protein
LRVDSWNNELVVRQSPAGMNLSTEAEDIVGILHQASTGEDIATSEDFIYSYAVVTMTFEVLDCRSYLQLRCVSVQ